MKNLLLLCVLVTLVSCSSSNPLLAPADALQKSAHKDLINKYIPNDPDLTDKQKDQRIKALIHFGALVDAEKERNNK